MTAVMQHRPDRTAEKAAFLAHIGWGAAKSEFLAGDASFRRYDRVHLNGTVAVLMDAPPPWEDVAPFLTITEILHQQGVSVPSILASDPAQGFLLLEDLGDKSFTRLLRAEPGRERELYLAATQALVAINIASASVVGKHDSIPAYDHAVYLREAALFSDWFLPQVLGLPKARELRAEYMGIWQNILSEAALKQCALVHRDYHADNLFWLADRAGHKAVGMIDYQDALWGDPAYDLASLLEDARRDVTDTTVADCFAKFVTDIGENAHAFATRFSVIAAQRNAKIIGIFTRLCVRDGKANYLDYLPRVWGHFMQDLSHPLLEPMRVFIETHVPPEWRGSFTANMAAGNIE